jgi:hypothetical protein
MIAVTGAVIVVFSLLERHCLGGMHGRLRHCNHSRLKGGNKEHRDGDKRAYERTPHSAMSGRIPHSFTFAICRIRKSSINGRMTA